MIQTVWLIRQEVSCLCPYKQVEEIQLFNMVECDLFFSLPGLCGECHRGVFRVHFRRSSCY